MSPENAAARASFIGSITALVLMYTPDATIRWRNAILGLEFEVTVQRNDRRFGAYRRFTESEAHALTPEDCVDIARDISAQLAKAGVQVVEIRNGR